MEKRNKTFTVTLVAPIQHVLPGIIFHDVRGAVEHAAKLAKSELEEFYGKDLPPWYATAMTAVDPSQPITLQAHDEAAPDASGDTFWQIAEDGQVVPLLTQLAATKDFIRHFLESYEKAVLFAWDDKVIRKLYQEAHLILNGTAAVMASPAKRKKAKTEDMQAEAARIMDTVTEIAKE